MGDTIILLNVLDINLNIINNYMDYKNNFILVMKCFEKSTTFNILQLPTQLQFNVKNFWYENNNNVLIDTRLKIALKHYVLQITSDHFDYILKKNLQTFATENNRLNIFTNMIMLKAFTSVDSIKVDNIITQSSELNKTLFIWDKKILGYIGYQYLSPTTWGFFENEWNNITQLAKFEKIMNFDRIFYKSIKENMLNISLDLWKNNFYSKTYTSFEHFFKNFDKMIDVCSKIHYNNLTNLIEEKQQSCIHLFNFVHNIDIQKIDNTYNVSCDVTAIDRYNSNFNINDFKNLDTFLNKIEILKNNELLLQYNKNNFNNSINNVLKNNFDFILFLNILKKKNNLSYIDKNLSYDIFKEVIDDCEKELLKCYLLEFNKSLNLAILTNLCKHSNLIFFYYIPKKNTFNKKNLIFFCQKSNLNYNKNRSFIFYENKKLILKVLSNNVKWEKVNYNHHLLLWKKNHQKLIANYIDLLTGGLVFFLPDHWGGY